MNTPRDDPRNPWGKEPLGHHAKVKIICSLLGDRLHFELSQCVADLLEIEAHGSMSNPQKRNSARLNPSTERSLRLPNLFGKLLDIDQLSHGTKLTVIAI